MPFSFENGFLSGQYTKKYSCRQIVTYRQVSGGIFYAIFSYFSDSLLGITAKEEELRFIGFHEGYVENNFWGQPFKDWEISAVYLYDKPVKEACLKIQESEVESVIFMDYEKVLAGIQKGTLVSCVYPKEFLMIKEAMEPGFCAEGVWVKEIIDPV